MIDFRHCLSLIFSSSVHNYLINCSLDLILGCCIVSYHFQTCIAFINGFHYPHHHHHHHNSLNSSSVSPNRGLWGGPVEWVGDLHQKKQNLWFQVGSGNPNTAHCEEATKGHDTMSDHRWVQEMQNGYATLQKRWVCVIEPAYVLMPSIQALV